MIYNGLKFAFGADGDLYEDRLPPGNRDSHDDRRTRPDHGRVSGGSGETCETTVNSA
jgi:hypothetical protein